jgi:hypothetical protein
MPVPAEDAAVEPTAKDFQSMHWMLNGFFVTQISATFADLNVPEHLAPGPLTAEQIVV